MISTKLKLYFMYMVMAVLTAILVKVYDADPYRFDTLSLNYIHAKDSLRIFRSMIQDEIADQKKPSNGEKNERIND